MIAISMGVLFSIKLSGIQAMPISGQRFCQLEQKHDPNILMIKIRNLVLTLVMYTTESCKHDNTCAFFH